MSEVDTSAPAGSTERERIAEILAVPPTFVEFLPLAAYACDERGRIVWFNRGAATLWGRSPRLGDDTELFCGSYKLSFGGREITREETPMARVLATGEPIQGVEGIVERPDGSRVSAMVHVAPVKDGRGKVLGAINCFHDTTDLHRVTGALRESQAELEDFFENGVVAMHLVGGDGTILRANTAELELLGYEPQDYIGRNIRDIHDDADGIADMLARLGRGEKLDRYPARLKARDGTIKHVLVTSSANFRDGRFVNTRCITVDVTEEILAKQHIVESEERFRQLLEALPAAVYTTDSEGRITYYNKAAADMAGRTPELGSDQWCVTWRLFDADGSPLPHDQCPMAVTLRENRPVRNVEALAERPDGTRVPFLPYPTPLRDCNGALVGAVNMLVDISERKKAEAHQALLFRELNHRVKNNMQMLQALLNASRREAADPQARLFLADAMRKVSSMAAAQQILYEEGSPADFNAGDFIKAVCTAARSTFPNHVGIDIDIDAREGLLPNDIAMPLALILNELLTNAVKHGINGSATGTIRVAFSPIAEGYQLVVEDDGPGFESMSASRRRSSGLGLVEGLARQIGGNFRVEHDNGARCIVQFEKTRTTTW
jgi:PAS domain S-box-containing protein